MERTSVNKQIDIMIILVITFLFASLYIGLESVIMEYGRNPTNNLLLRFLPVLIIQFGMSGLGISFVMIKNREKLSQYGLVKKNALKSIAGCLIMSVPTILFLVYFNEISGFMPFGGMFLTKEILNAPFPLNILGYFIIAAVWGFFEGLFYVVLADKINKLKPPCGFFNLGALICAVFSILIHGMIGLSAEVLSEALATFILMYGSLSVYEKTGNAWGNILIFFVVWNAL